MTEEMFNIYMKLEALKFEYIYNLYCMGDPKNVTNNYWFQQEAILREAIHEITWQYLPENCKSL